MNVGFNGHVLQCNLEKHDTPLGMVVEEEMAVWVIDSRDRKWVVGIHIDGSEDAVRVSVGRLRDRGVDSMVLEPCKWDGDRVTFREHSSRGCGVVCCTVCGEAYAKNPYTEDSLTVGICGDRACLSEALLGGDG